ncbi:NAD-dependent epimerase/dehydratase family protein [Halomonas koreensis]|uniref:NAD-dependent epimerase/dehydratase family protein n=1 Tax=Halomonas koreensis TaxID=245385 RepID=A0ABU1FZ43_9GAMM|nr:NAD-dependent epimerase/dehydratase family protein [Halomonas koreensis]MDR5865948.1 NAD-dependent epimerase/dehydratase family protein [Halomonas koreensis]
MSEVVGNGMLAKAFMARSSDVTLPDGCVFFCSGVSNSSEVKKSEFQRERELAIKEINKADASTFVYFSSVASVTESSEYYKHKLEMENVVGDLSKSYLIFRLPQVVGCVNNNTLFPSFIRKIKKGEPLEIYSKSTRCLIDVDDVVRLSSFILKKGYENTTIDLCPCDSITPLELARLISKEVGVKSKVEIVDKGGSYPYGSHEDKTIIGEDDSIFSKNYYSLVVKKYAKKIFAIT